MTNILVIGGGSIGERHLRCFLKTGRAKVSLCEINDELRQRIAQEYTLEGSYRSLDDALQRSFDAAVICTPAPLHIPMATRLAQADINLLIEKPLSTSEDGIAELAELAESKGLAVSIAYVYRAHPALIEMKQALERGRFGEPVELVATSGQHFPLYRPAYRDIYYARRESGGGAIQDALTHVVNAGEWLVGPVSSVSADADHCVLEGVEVEDTVHAITRHGKVLGSFSLNQHQAPNESKLTIVCTRGTVRMEMNRHRWLSGVEPGHDWKLENEFAFERDDLFVRQADAFLDHVDGKKPAACTLSEALQTLRVNLAMLKAVDNRQWVDLC